MPLGTATSLSSITRWTKREIVKYNIWVWLGMIDNNFSLALITKVEHIIIIQPQLHCISFRVQRTKICFCQKWYLNQWIQNVRIDLIINFGKWTIAVRSIDLELSVKIWLPLTQSIFGVCFSSVYFLAHMSAFTYYYYLHQSHVFFDLPMFMRHNTH